MADSADAAVPGVGRLVVVAGSGRSGTSTIAGVLKHLGLHLPQPEVPATKANPRGHFEPAWVVAFQRRLLDRVHVPLFDARPSAFALTARVSARPAVGRELRDWLAGEMGHGPELVVKDPRNSWFLPMWRSAAEQVGLVPGVVTMLRHPAEVVGSHRSAYGLKKERSKPAAPYKAANRTANWVNLTLAIEHTTRDMPRAFVSYVELVADWRAAMRQVGASLDLSFAAGFDDAAAAAVDDFVDPDLYRVKTAWEEVDAPAELRDLAEQVWQEMERLRAEGRTGRSDAALDSLRSRYADYYGAAEAVAASSVRAAASAEPPVAEPAAARPDVAGAGLRRRVRDRLAGRKR